MALPKFGEPKQLINCGPCFSLNTTLKCPQYHFNQTLFLGSNNSGDFWTKSQQVGFCPKLQFCVEGGYNLGGRWIQFNDGRVKLSDQDGGCTVEGRWGNSVISIGGRCQKVNMAGTSCRCLVLTRHFLKFDLSLSSAGPFCLLAHAWIES